MNQGPWCGPWPLGTRHVLSLLSGTFYLATAIPGLGCFMTRAPQEKASPSRVCHGLRGPGDRGEESGFLPAHSLPHPPKASRGTSLVWGALRDCRSGP